MRAASHILRHGDPFSRVIMSVVECGDQSHGKSHHKQQQQLENCMCVVLCFGVLYGAFYALVLLYCRENVFVEAKPPVVPVLRLVEFDVKLSEIFKLTCNYSAFLSSPFLNTNFFFFRRLICYVNFYVSSLGHLCLAVL